MAAHRIRSDQYFKKRGKKKDAIEPLNVQPKMHFRRQILHVTKMIHEKVGKKKRESREREL